MKGRSSNLIDLLCQFGKSYSEKDFPSELIYSKYLIHGGEIDPNSTSVLPVISHLPSISYSEEQWIKSLWALVAKCSELNQTVISSYGLKHWDFISWCAGVMKVKLIIVLEPANDLPPESVFKKILNDLLLDESRTTFIQPIIPKVSDVKISLKLRDHLAFKLADRHPVICLRKNSRWLDYLTNCQNVDNRFACEYPQSGLINWRRILGSCEINSDVLPTGFVTHWTRGCNSRWEGERSADYFHDLVARSSGNPRSAFVTLKHILLTGVLRSNDSLFRDSTNGISFTELPPHLALKLIRFRTTFHRYNFEPYGICIKKDLLISLGMRKVIYGNAKSYGELKEEEKPFFQNVGNSGDLNWSLEKEWRLLSDLDINSIKDQVIILVPGKRECYEIATDTGFQAESLGINFES